MNPWETPSDILVIICTILLIIVVLAIIIIGIYCFLTRTPKGHLKNSYAYGKDYYNK